ncbi:hypothetical protein XHC_0032 [Xanthomonas hortorum pv. carotae str. M081]|nr:hypothetical protein XHC_0032 [Xanthomonas hortorum pv. carotae str. M081]
MRYAEASGVRALAAQRYAQMRGGPAIARRVLQDPQ